MKRLFGTDGMRGEAGAFPLDAATVRTVGRSLARHLGEKLGRAPLFVTGRDTRASGFWIEHSFAAGARAAGAHVETAGVITTPGVAYLARRLPADAGIVVSASHNPYRDNGIKIFTPEGRKLDDATERQIESDIYAEFQTEPPSTSTAHEGDAVEKERGSEEEERRADVLRAFYLEYLCEEVGAGLSLEGLTLVVDCANGAASGLAPTLLSSLGARVIAINNAPDGRNINLDCGSLHTEHLCQRVVEEGAHMGVAFDGDADRSLFADARGRLVDGDATLWVLSKFFQSRGELAGERVVATVMSNIGLELALRTRGIELLRADVGDKYVLEKLLETGATLGGEQSGHIIFPRTSLAGDGMITTLNLLRAMREEGRALEELNEGFERYPQVLTNVRVREKRPFEDVEEIARAAEDVRARLEGRGRLLLRYSGTEPLARVMIEGPGQEEIEALAAELANVIRHALGEG